MTRYVIMPGWVTSRSDGDRHYVSAGRLAELYGVKKYVVERPGFRPFPDDIILTPRHDGDYTLETK